MSGQPYTRQWLLDTMDNSDITLSAGNAACRLYQTDPTAKRLYINADMPNGYTISFMFENINIISLTHPPFYVGGSPRTDVRFRGKNKITAGGASSSAFKINTVNNFVSITGGITDTLELTGGSGVPAVSLASGGSGNFSLAFGGVLLVNGDYAIADDPNSLKFDTIIINRGKVAHKDASRQTSIGGKPSGTGSPMVVINGGSVDKIKAEQVVINGGSVRGSVEVTGAGCGGKPCNKTGAPVYAGKLRKPRVEGVWVDGVSYNIRFNHSGTDTLTLYMPRPADKHAVNVVAGGISTADTAEWDAAGERFVFRQNTPITRTLTRNAFPPSVKLTMTYGRTTPLNIAGEIRAETTPHAAVIPLPAYMEPNDLIIKYRDSILLNISNETLATPRAYGFSNIPVNTLNAGKYPITLAYGGNAALLPLIIDTFLWIRKDTPVYAVPGGIAASYLDYLSDVPLTAYATQHGFWEWHTPADTVGEVGARRRPARFVPTDTTNYVTIDALLEIQVNRCTPSINTTLRGILNDSLRRVDLPACWQWADLAAVMTASGAQSFAALYTCDTAHYAPRNTLEVEVGAEPLPTGLQAVYGDTLSKSVRLPAGWQWTPDGAVGNAGWQWHTARYTDITIYPYVEVTTKIAIWVRKARPPCNVLPQITAPYGSLLNEAALWDASRTDLSHADTGWQWAAPADPVGNAGSRPHRAIFTPIDTANYLVVDSLLIVKVGKIYPIFTAPANLRASYGSPLSAVDLPQDWEWQSPADLVGNANRQIWHRAWYLYDTANYIAIDTALLVSVGKATAAYPASAPVFTYGDALNTLALPVPWVWINPADSAGSAGRRRHNIRVGDTANYIAQDTFIWVNVRKATPAFNLPVNLTARYGCPLGSVWLWDTLLPFPAHADTGWQWASPSERVGSAGAGYYYRAIFTPLDTANYLTIDTALYVWVTKAKPSPRIPSGLAAFTGDTLQGITPPLPEGWQWTQPRASVGSKGSRPHQAIFTHADTANYDTIMRPIVVFVAQKTTIRITVNNGIPAAQERTPDYFVIDNCTETSIDIDFVPDDCVALHCISALCKNQPLAHLAAFNVDKPKVYTLKYRAAITFDGITAEKELSVRIEKPFPFDDIVVRKQGKILFVNNNPLRTGYSFVAYQWYRGGEPVGNGGQYYYEASQSGGAGNLSPQTRYSVRVTTDEGDQIGSCEGQGSRFDAASLKVYPNPVRRGGIVTLQLPPALQSEPLTVSIVSMSGVVIVDRQSVSPYAPQVHIPADIGLGIYLLKTPLGEAKIIVE